MATVPPTPDPLNPDAPNDPPPQVQSGERKPTQAKKGKRGSSAQGGSALAAVMIGVVVLLAVLLAVAIGNLFVLKGRYTQQQLFITIALFSLIAAVMVFALFTVARVTTGGQGPWGPFQAAGPPAAFIVFFGILRFSAPAPESRPINVYVSVVTEDGKPSSAIVGRFEIVYRRPNGQALVVGQDETAVVQDLPRDAQELEVNRINCFQYIPRKLEKRERVPWKYPIQKDSVTIEMVKIQPEEPPLPSSKEVRRLLDKLGYQEKTILKPGGFDKGQVVLTIQNDADIPITFVAFDCTLSYRNQEGALGGGIIWANLREQSDIQPEGKVTWGNFDNFQAPTGWFALYVRFNHWSEPRVVQESVGIFNLFRIKEPKIVIERTGGGESNFRVNRERSKLGQ